MSMRGCVGILLGLGALTSACGSDPAEPVTGALELTLSTTGQDLDPDGYTVTVDAGNPLAVPVNGTTSIPDLDLGVHTVTLAGLASNCALTTPAPLEVTVPGAAGAVATMEIACTAATGALELTIITTGIPLDPDGFSVTVDHEAARLLAPNFADTVWALSPGPHTVQLAGVAAFCVLEGENPRTVDITAGDTVGVRFDLTCDTPVLQVSVSTTGSEVDYDGYHVSIDGEVVGSVLPDDTIRIPYLSSGPHTVALTGVAPNCAVTGEHPRTINLVDGAGSVHLDVVCHLAITLGVYVETSGGDPDPDGYVATLNAGSRIGIVGGLGSFAGGWFLPPDDYTVVLSDVAPHCALSGSNTATATVVSEGSVTVTFSVTCGRLRTAPSGHDITVHANSEIYLLSANGSRFVDLTNHPDDEWFATWSPDGQEIAFTSGHHVLDDPNCVPSPLGPSCGHHLVSHVFVMNADGSGRTRLTNGEREEGNAWSRDGTKIAYLGTSSDSSYIFVMNADGSGQSQLTSIGRTSVFLQEGELAWSPNGTRIAYSNRVTDNPGILVINPDGSGLTRLTDGIDVGPAWSPDGTKIAFMRAMLGQGADIYVMNADGSGLVQLSSHTGVSSSLSWSPDGRKITFEQDGAIYLVNGNGTGLVQLTFGPRADCPAWSPDGNKIAYYLRLSVTEDHLYLMNPDGSGEVPLPLPEGFSLSCPVAWRP